MSIRALYTAASGMKSQQINIDVISHNLANVNTNGYKMGRADFQDLLYQSVRPAGASATTGTEVPTGISIGLGSQPSAVQKLFSPGSFANTGNPLDLAINNDGFFRVTLANGDTAYTRAGSFKKDSTGRMVTSDGDPLGDNITIPTNAEQINIGMDGTVSIIANNQPQTIGNIQLARFSNPAGLNAMGRNLFRESTSSGRPTIGTPGQNGIGEITQGFLELSNVAVVDELVNMIVAQRAYEVNSKAIQTSDEMLQTANNAKR
ncbi:MAG: flagellar basal-body rod protein FlgG [Candidatus Sumerlaeota bacterium]|nr:flagellar basal-body rod protein FlgG [Candidatus Sumerlaeota bacterium]